jgi:hypothetical protein
MLAPLVAAVTAAAVRPDPGQARAWLERELGRPEYDRNLSERFLSWLGELWAALSQAALGATPLSTGTAVLGLVVLVTLVLVLAGRVRREPAPVSRDGNLLVAAEVSADQHRAAARAALDAGDPETAIVEAFRAVASTALDRGLLEPRPGLTAHELSGDLGPVFPQQQDALAEAAVLFDVVFYGHQPATAADARSVLDLDDALSVARPTRRAASGPATSHTAGLR